MSVFLAPKALLQILILTFGIYLLLSFLRTTRGSGLVSGVSLILIVGVYGMGMVAQAYGLVEIEGIILGLQSLVIVIIAVIFQPELRRGIFALSENTLLGRFLRTHRKEVVIEVAAAVVAMAKKKQGALIAFERKTPLDAYIEGAVKLDAEVNHVLLDSVFQSGGALHDGAVIIRADRLVAAGSLFPLTENVEISKSTGTRHRAALGLTEETDAVAVAVSEETGFISICKRGKIERRVPRAQLEELLRERVGSDEAPASAEEDGQDKPPWFLRAVSQNMGQKLVALILATLVFYGAYQGNMGTIELDLQIAQAGSEIAPNAKGRTLAVMLKEGHRFSPRPEEMIASLVFSGPRELLAPLKEAGQWQVAAIVEDPVEEDGELAAEDRVVVRLELDGITRNGVGLEDGVAVSWADGPPPLMSELFTTSTLQLEPGMVFIDPTELDERYEVDTDGIVFDPSYVSLSGPQTKVAALLEAVAGGETLLADVHLAPGHRPSQRLTSELRAYWGSGEVTIEQGQVEIEIPVQPVEVEFRALDIIISLQHFDTESPRTREFDAPSQGAQVTIITRGLVNGERDSDDWIADRAAIVRFVKQHLRVFVYVDDIEAGSNRSRLHQVGLEDWRTDLPLEAGRFAQACKDAAQEDLRIVFDDPEIQLVEIVKPTEDDETPSGGAEDGQ